MSPVLNIVVPMAGRGQRFVDAGYKVPKPLIPVHGQPMIQRVIKNIAPLQAPHRFIFIALAEHLQSHDLAAKLQQWAPGCVIVPVTAVTEGAACTVLLAEKDIDTDDPMIIANCDQWVMADMDAFVAAQEKKNLDGLIMTMTASDPKWSFVKMNDAGLVTDVQEKNPISDQATVGIYMYRRGRDFVAAARQMIRKEIRVNNEFYVAPVYNEMIATGARIGCFSIGSVEDGMYGMGTPDDLAVFLSNPISYML